MHSQTISLLTLGLTIPAALALPTIYNSKVARQCGPDTVNVASSFSPSIQCSPVLDDDTTAVSPDVEILRRDPEVAVSAEEDIAVLRRQECGSDTVNVASSFSPSIQCSDVLDDDTVAVDPTVSALGVTVVGGSNSDDSSSTEEKREASPSPNDSSSTEECGDGTINVASSFSPSIQCSEVLSDDTLDVDPDVTVLRS